MDVQDFIDKNSRRLANVLGEYLTSNLHHDDVQEHVNCILADWDRLAKKSSTPFVEGEKAFWCAMWSTQHLASEDHWNEGVAQRDLAQLLAVLNGKESLPAKTGRRAS